MTSQTIPSTTNAPGRIVEQLRRMHEGDAWHGPALTEALAGVTAAQAIQRPIAEAHTIYELTFHLAAWVGEVIKRLKGRDPQMPDEGDFPPAPASLSEKEWSDLKALLARRHDELAEIIATFDDSKLGEMVGVNRDAPSGTGVTYYAMLHGIIQHDAYHCGQIVLLGKALVV